MTKHINQRPHNKSTALLTNGTSGGLFAKVLKCLGVDIELKRVEGDEWKGKKKLKRFTATNLLEPTHPSKPHTAPLY
jgi:hypothetical protein